MSGPLTGMRVVELAGLGPAPFAAMLLADMGAEVVRIDRRERAGSSRAEPHWDLLNRGKRSVALDLKRAEGVEAVLSMVTKADGLIEGFRPGVTERLGLGPDVCLARNPRLVYGRMTGWGQDGPLAQAAGHDINYIALAGALAHIGRRDQAPTVPLNLVGDFGGGGMLLAFGMACAWLEAARSGRGQVVDAAMVDGTAVLMTMLHAFAARGAWSDVRGDNLLDTGAPFYDTYETADGRFVAVGALEPQFYQELMRLTGLDAERFGQQMDRRMWPALRAALAEAFKQHSLAEWCGRMEGSDACFAPVLTMGEAASHPHNRARGTFAEREGIRQPAPAPRFSRTVPELPASPPHPGQDTGAVLRAWGFSEAELDALERAGVVAGRTS
ncbi:MAG: CaiB/BaiF CoA-transferase family protein, partial [Myxococcales bacterium]|nr:CaiB/BaiF CoA-transferase family protein [Myxococcales bacterium]